MTNSRLSLSAATTTLAGGLWPGWALAQTPSAVDCFGYHPRMMWWDGGGSGMFFGPLFMIVILAATVAGVVLLIRWIGGAQQGFSGLTPVARAPLDILKERFAKGEMNKEEFEDHRRILDN
jgi:putative membrane protein